MAKPTSGTGRAGKTYEERELAKTVRNLALNKIRIILNRPAVEMSDRDKTLHDEILMRLAGSILPRLNAGRDDDEILYPAPLLASKTKNELQNNNSTEQTAGNEKKDS